MRFQITMNMPARNGNSVHQIIGDHPSESLEAFAEALNVSDFIIVDELYRHDGDLKPQGPVVLNPMFIGKIKEYRP
jgi:hypothetical protein